MCSQRLQEDNELRGNVRQYRWGLCGIAKIGNGGGSFCAIQKGYEVIPPTSMVAAILNFNLLKEVLEYKF